MQGCVTVAKTGIISARRPQADNAERILLQLLHMHGGCPPWGSQSQLTALLILPHPTILSHLSLPAGH